MPSHPLLTVIQTPEGACHWRRSRAYYKLGKYGFGMAISAIAGVLIFLLSMLVFEEDWF